MLPSPLAERTALSSNLPATPAAGSGLLLLYATVDALHCGRRSRLLQDATLLSRPGQISRTIAAGEACGLRRCARPDPPRPGVCRRRVHCSRRGAQGRATLVGSRAAEAAPDSLDGGGGGRTPLREDSGEGGSWWLGDSREGNWGGPFGRFSFGGAR
jgi:hypothetical protein